MNKKQPLLTKIISFSLIYMIGANAFAIDYKINKYFMAPKVSLFKNYGVKFNCSKSEILEIKKETKKLVDQFELNDLVNYSEDNNNFSIFIPSEFAVGSTLNISENPIFKIKKDIVDVPTKEELSKVATVSKKEILISLLYPGRLTEYSNENCKIDSLKDDIGIRQNIVLWSQNLDWEWPNGGSAYWNKDYWDKGTPLYYRDGNKIDFKDAFLNMFLEQSKYAIGCYTASKVVYVHAYLDYYSRVNKNEEKLARLEKILLSDAEPLVGIEPESMWYFEKEFNKKNLNKNGKILKIIPFVEANNFVPGDWNYFRNTDIKTQNKIGYEGSNAIYLGSNIFDDYYNDHSHGYPYERKLDEVYQWRNKVFSRNRDKKLIKNLTNEERFKLTLPPSKGGLVETYRVVPIVF